MFAANAEARDLEHEEVLGDWPDVAALTPNADVVTCHHVAYNVSEIAPFIEHLSAHAHNRVVLEVPQQHPLAGLSAAWKLFWNLERPTEPTSELLVEVIKEIGYAAEFAHWQADAPRQVSIDDETRFTRIRLCLDQSRDNEVREFLTNQSAPAARRLTTIWWDV